MAKAGRPKGSGSVSRTAVLAAIRARLGEKWDPISDMAVHAHRLSQAAHESGDREDTKVAIDALDKLGQYLLPRLKATELDITSSDGSLAPNVIKLVAVRDEREIAVQPAQELVGGRTE